MVVTDELYIKTGYNWQAYAEIICILYIQKATPDDGFRREFYCIQICLKHFRHYECAAADEYHVI